MLIYNYYFAILILAIIFFLISNKNPSILIAIIIIIIIGYNYFNKINDYNQNLTTTYENKIQTLEKDMQTTYLANDKTLVELLLNIRFIRIFDNDRYSTLIYLAEKLTKVYIFMLANRYDINKHFSSFLIIRNELINNLYSSYLILPDKLRFIYGIKNPYKKLTKTINDIIKHTRQMIVIIKKYAFEFKDIKYLEDTKYKPSNYYDKIHDVF